MGGEIGIGVRGEVRVSIIKSIRMGVITGPMGLGLGVGVGFMRCIILLGVGFTGEGIGRAIIKFRFG